MTGLADRLRARIEADGPISFAAFMEAALYDRAEGFFVRDPVGTHFTTAPHLSPVFAACVASMLVRALANLGDADELHLVEGGAGGGVLAEQILASAPALAALHYRALEQDPMAGDALARRALGFASSGVVVSPTDLGQGLAGVFFANELFDNIPFHRLRARADGLVEVAVGIDPPASFVEMERPAPPDLVELASRAPSEDGEVLVSPMARRLLERVLAAFDRGYLVVVDYGEDGDGEGGPVRGYRGHEAVTDVLEAPGTCDITGPVDMRALCETATAAGWEPAGTAPIVTQRAFLYAFGYRAFLHGLADQQAQAEARGDHRRAVALWNARGEATMLVDEAQLGAFKVLAMKTPGLPNLW